MSDDFDFNADDLFDDDFDDFDDDDDFGGDDDFAGETGDDDFGANLDLDFMDDDDEFGDDEFGDDDFDDEFSGTGSGAGGPGISRGVMILGGGMLLILVIFLILVLFLIFNPSEGPFALTEAAIFTENANIETQIAETSTQSIINQTGTAEADMTGTSDAIEEGTSSAQTQIAVDFQVTSAALTQVVLGETATADAQETANAEMTANQIALTGQADTNATQTEISFQQTLNPDVTIPVLATTAVPPEATMPAEEPTLDLPAVAQTATALANLFSTPPTTAPVAGTPIAQNTEQASSTTGTTTGSTTGSTALPDTGLADDLFQLFAGDPRLALLAAFGLLGIIMISRGVRSANRKRKDD